MNIVGVTKKRYRYVANICKLEPGEILPGGFLITMHTGFLKKDIGYCQAYLYGEDKRTELSSFLDMSQVPSNKPLCLTDINVEGKYGERGYGGELVNLLLSLLRQQDVVHIADFTSMGLERLGKNFQAPGYHRIKVLPGAEIPREYNRAKWMFCDYDGIERLSIP